MSQSFLAHSSTCSFCCISRSRFPLEAGRHQHLAHTFHLGNSIQFNSTVSVEVKPNQIINFNTIKNAGLESRQKCQNRESIDTSVNYQQLKQTVNCSPRGQKQSRAHIFLYHHIFLKTLHAELTMSLTEDAWSQFLLNFVRELFHRPWE